MRGAFNLFHCNKIPTHHIYYPSSVAKGFILYACYCVHDVTIGVFDNIFQFQQFRRPHMMHNLPDTGSDAIMRGLIDMSIQTRDPFITKEVSRHLFAEHPPRGLGEDLMSLNIMRGRDHGLPGRDYGTKDC